MQPLRIRQYISDILRPGTTSAAAGRIAYFDLAKGICILLVVLFHLREYYASDCITFRYTDLIRMPFYFFLSGYFFKTYSGFGEFSRKKAHNLLLPFAFFYLITSVILPILLSRFTGIEIQTGNDWRLIYRFLTYDPYPNIPLWFLWALFWVNLIYYGLSRLFRNNLLLGMVCFLLTYILGTEHFLHLPAAINNMMDGLWFFWLGHTYHHNLSRIPQRWYHVLASAFVFIISASLPISGELLLILRRMLVAPIGIVALIGTCRYIGSLPIVSFFGRYSLMILVTHVPIIHALTALHICNGWLLLLSIIMISMILIPLMRKFLPHVTAQK